MSPVVVAAAVFGFSAAVSGWFVVSGSWARVSGWLLVGGGVVVLAACGALVVDLPQVAGHLFRAGGSLLVPLALAVYPRPVWREPLSFLLVVVVAGAGTIAVAWLDGVEAMGFATVAALLVRFGWGFERGSADDRRALAWCALAWIAAGLSAMFLVFLAESVRGSNAFGVGAVTAVGLLLASFGPPAMAVGVVRPELVDVRALVTRAVVAATVLVVYLSSAAGLAALTELLRGRPLESAPTMVLCAVLAFGVHPLQVVLRGVVDELLFGRRPDPLVAATRVVDRVGSDPVLALQAIRESLVLPYASLRVDGAELAASGVVVAHTRTLPLQLDGDAVGEVVVGLRPGDLALGEGDEQVLGIVAPLLAQALRSRALARQLQESRSAVITAIEEERRRLRRDLHDGLGPTLTGVAFAADAARNQLASDPAEAERLLVRLRKDTAAAIDEVRRLVEGLRPPALDELGLVGAVRQHAAGLHTADGSALAVTIAAPEPMPDLPAATEVAGYRIVVEALTNVARHAGATSAHVDIRVDDSAVTLAVHDDGRGSTSWTPGVGLSSMRERAEQVGGRLDVRAGSHGGRVEAVIPMGRPGPP